MPLRHLPKALFATAITLLFVHGLSAQLPEGTKVLKDLAYVTDGHAHQKLDLYIPATPKGPLLVYIHGGAWWAGSKNNAQGLGMLPLGYTVASVEYRFSQHAPFPAQIEDCKAAIRWLRAHAKDHGYDPDRIAVMGDSAGGHLTALLATTGHTREFDVGELLDYSSAVQCGIDFYGPTDFPGWIPPSGEPLVQRDGDGSALVQLFGGTIKDKLELATKASPVFWVTKDAAPLLILHGTKDPLVDLSQSRRLTEKLKAADVEVTLDIVEGGGHGGAAFFAPERLLQMVGFLEKHLAARTE